MKYFDYNKNKVTNSDKELATILNKIEDQIKKGRKSITLNIYSSASKVPTKTFGSNDKLAQSRAENLQKELKKYFESKPELASKISVVIKTVIVDGPEYDRDANNNGKYRPYQFVGFKTE
jgi:hypothetical protein